jgi:hypothetical protein
VPVYSRIVEESRGGTYVGGSEYFDADAGAMGLLGFMEGEELQPGAADLPEEDLALIRDTLAQMLAGEFTALTSSPGRLPITRVTSCWPKGKAWSRPTSTACQQFGSPCKTCMYWWNENVTAELPVLE